MKIGNAIDSFLRYCENERKLSPRTRRAYESDLHQFFEPNETRAIESVTEREVERLMKALAGSDYRDSSVRRKLAALKVFFRWAEEQTYVGTSPVANVSLGKSPARRPVVLSSDEIEALLAAPKHEMQRLEPEKDAGHGSQNRYFCAVRDNAILEMLFSTGIRIGELVSLDTNDVDRVAGSVRVRGRRDRDRSVPVVSMASRWAVDEYLGLRCDRAADSNALFVGRSNTRLTIYSIENIFRKHLESCEIGRHVTPHVLRHTAAVRMVDGGTDLHRVKELLGHASILSTQVYANMSGDRGATLPKTESPHTDPGLRRGPIGSAED